MVTLKETGERIELSHRYEYIPLTPSVNKVSQDETPSHHLEENEIPSKMEIPSIIEKFPEPAMA